MLPYRSMTGEELIKEILSGYRRIATTILLLAGTQVTSSIGTVAVDPVDPQAALDRDQLRDRQTD